MKPATGRGPMLWVVGTAALVTLAVALFVPPVAQDPAYHEFADQRTLAGIPNFWNVMTNVAISAAGFAGLWLACGNRGRVLANRRTAYVVMFAGAVLTGMGSAWYHVDPSNGSLVWDRLPMTVVFMAFFASALADFFPSERGHVVLWPLLVAGVGSVAWWAFTESLGRGDLRPYAIVQFLPGLLIVIMLILRRPASGMTRMYWMALAAYLAAKVVEFLDVGVYSLGGLISGHSIKHLFVAAAVLILILPLVDRPPPASG